MSNTRELGTIAFVRFGPEPDHGCHVAEVSFAFAGSHQSLSFVQNASNVKSFLADVLRLFGTSDSESLVGREAWALRPTSAHDERIIGIEVAGTDGRFHRLTLDGWMRRHRIPGTGNGKAARLAAMDRERTRLMWQAADLQEKARKLEDDWVEWVDDLDDLDDLDEVAP